MIFNKFITCILISFIIEYTYQKGVIMLVSSIVGFNFGNTQISSQNIQKVQNKPLIHRNNNNNCQTCCPKGRKTTTNALPQNHKLSILA